MLSFKASMTTSQQDTAAQAEPDLVLPLHYFDNSAMFTNITMYAIMVFDDVLDSDKLASSLEQLVRRETWQKLGARVRKGVGLPNTVLHSYCGLLLNFLGKRA